MRWIKSERAKKPWRGTHPSGLDSIERGESGDGMLAQLQDQGLARVGCRPCRDAWLHRGLKLD